MAELKVHCDGSSSDNTTLWLDGIDISKHVSRLELNMETEGMNTARLTLMLNHVDAEANVLAVIERLELEQADAVSDSARLVGPFAMPGQNAVSDLIERIKEVKTGLVGGP